MTSIVPGGMSDAAELAIKARAFAAASGLASTANTFEAPARAAKRASTANGPVPRSRTTQPPACARTLRLIASPKADVRASSCSIASYISSVKLTNAAAPSTEGCHELPSSFDSIDEAHDRGAVIAKMAVGLDSILEFLPKALSTLVTLEPSWRHVRDCESATNCWRLPGFGDFPPAPSHSGQFWEETQEGLLRRSCLSFESTNG